MVPLSPHVGASVSVPQKSISLGVEVLDSSGKVLTLHVNPKLDLGGSHPFVAPFWAVPTAADSSLANMCMAKMTIHTTWHAGGSEIPAAKFTVPVMTNSWLWFGRSKGARSDTYWNVKVVLAASNWAPAIPPSEVISY